MLLGTVLLLAGAGCSNFLIDPRIDPNLPDRRGKKLEAALGLSPSLAAGVTSPFRRLGVTIAWSDEAWPAPERLIPENASIADFHNTGAATSFTLTALSAGRAGFVLPAGSVTNSSGDGNDAVAFDWIFNPDALSLAIGASPASPSSSTVFDLTFNFTEAVSGFAPTSGDTPNRTTVQGPAGAVFSGFGGGGSTYTARLTLPGEGTYTILTEAGAAVDALAGLTSSDGATLSLVVDTTPPIPSLSGS
ncbi:MAG: hypothetical protein JNG85_09655, partial [Spirochaetaceae bacterium]|nr:hypothetical protein [Spirochaetaceae bacterium]